MRQARGGLEKVLEAAGASHKAADQDQRCLGSQWDTLAPDGGEAHALFEEGKPTQNNC